MIMITYVCFDYEVSEKSDQKKTLEKTNEKKLQQPELEGHKNDH